MKKILFLTATRADFGKLKSLIKLCQKYSSFDVRVFITGMHMLPEYGETRIEVLKSGLRNCFSYVNQYKQEDLDNILVSTISGLSAYVKLNKPDMIIVHGDRTEALAGAIVGAFNNIYVGHIEGGEVSGTIDESIRHAVSKLSHIHFASNKEAEKRLVQMGEPKNTIHVIGSPDTDIMLSKNLPSLEKAKKYYEIEFNDYGILMYHPVTTIKPYDLIEKVKKLVDSVLESEENYVVIYPNNDPGSDLIREQYERLKHNPRFRIFPSLRFEYFLILLKNSSFIIGNSSAGLREAPYYGIPTVNLGSRQNGRYKCVTILDAEEEKDIVPKIKKAKKMPSVCTEDFGRGDSANNFLNVLKNEKTWSLGIQKRFIDFNIHDNMG